MDPRFEELAEIMVGYSTGVKKGDRVLLQTDVSTPYDMHRAIVSAVREAGGTMMAPIVTDPRLNALCVEGGTQRRFAADAAAYMVRMLSADVRIAFRGFHNIFEQSGIPDKDTQLHEKIMTGLTIEEGIEGTRWVLTRWPTPAFAQLAGLSTDKFEEYFWNAVLADYPKMARSVKPLVRLINQTKKVRITGPGTDITFSIEGLTAVPCVGDRNIPDGEVFTAPVRDSVNGKITYNTVVVTRDGKRFEGLWFVFKDGKIIKSGCESGDPSSVEKILDTDEGARFIGEFSFGINWGITQTVGETLFDEKCGGTLHFTPGKSYGDCSNGNQSAVHWDIVLDQREKQGGCKIYFDGKLIRKDGLFTLDALQRLNS